MLIVIFPNVWFGGHERGGSGSELSMWFLTIEKTYMNVIFVSNSRSLFRIQKGFKRINSLFDLDVRNDGKPANEWLLPGELSNHKC